MTHKIPGGGRELDVETLARVEGEGAMRVVVEAGRVADVQLRIYEPPRFFEAMLRGRAHTEPPDITSRICGICPVAYEMSSCLAIEDACGVTVPEEVRLLRRLLYCGEWIESHALHVYLLHLPDFLGYPGAVEMSADHRDEVERGLALKKAGNALMSLVGGRAVHPVNVRVGGFYRLPTRAEMAAVRPQLARALDDAVATVVLTAGLDFADFEQDYEYVALRSDHDEYPLESGAFVTSSGAGFPARDFGDWVTEQHVAHSNALHARLRDVGPYVVGPLARYTLNHDRLPPVARRAADEAGLGPTCRNPFRSIVVRAVELVVACEEALRIIDGWQDGGAPSVPVPPRAATGHGATEAPRGVLYHRYSLAGDGTILDAEIVPPTSQNQASIELDLRAYVQDRLELDDEELTRQCEQAIRNYDPCISCATHFLDLEVERR
ncbi:Ni/Fe hydrogenase subunit alpha [Nocardioides guangzhouensis]|uniref:Ni/Fe hydrogenase subunit alpha n=1 Tax=Nocardioides guangzhouensis TaxID=2497878 RepID=A0A4Q4Z7D1_9ACTN|nr:Ni/Fe hydrogenase subunit alpha [Nocardioides guangzhouensis]RYP83041.1 Ni/Fe hydrogenase subunit alpha [Nocardioides guangzhouensis]